MKAILTHHIRSHAGHLLLTTAPRLSTWLAGERQGSRQIPLRQWLALVLTDLFSGVLAF